MRDGMTPYACCTAQQPPCGFLLLLLVAVVGLHAAALLPSRSLFLARAGRTYSYTMYTGSAVTSESLLTGPTTCPYVFSEGMNRAVVAMLNGFLAAATSNVSAVGGGFPTCIDNNLAKRGGTACFKSLLAAAAPADCPAANRLCCPLFWRVENQDLHTTMAQVNPQTIFWNGATSVNGFYTNFSRSYLDANSNCGTPLFNTTSPINLAMDAYGEWRFVHLVTAFTLLETGVDPGASGATPSLGENPQSAILNAVRLQQPFQAIIMYIAGGVDVLLLLLLLFFAAYTSYSIYRREVRVREYQTRTVDVVSQYHKRRAWAVIDELESSQERGSSENGVQGNKEQQRPVSSRRAAALAHPLALQPEPQLPGTRRQVSASPSSSQPQTLTHAIAPPTHPQHPQQLYGQTEAEEGDAVDF
ncbi:hypothetical protein LSCM1_04854 [Leishmania martiniquensis]|uniref:Uncharacterized protein n=1 Tax=Leishmania martiniquensis TaxID=1580590 RepID=A0A836HSB5_9TRYP|nr:hypothetical protein LSCM1_04854 [Leishmania martiniquensis]